jgi:hypothetical protein
MNRRRATEPDPACHNLLIMHQILANMQHRPCLQRCHDASAMELRPEFAHPTHKKAVEREPAVSLWLWRGGADPRQMARTSGDHENEFA